MARKRDEKDDFKNDYGNIYRVHDPNLLQKYLRVKILEHNFEYVTYIQFLEV